MTILLFVISGPLLGIAALHLLWAVGYWFPIRDEALLVRAVVGLRTADRMPGAIPCALVTVALMITTAALWWPPGVLRSVVLGVAAAVLMGRGLLTYLPGWRRLATHEPFATLDRRYYGPLCLILGAGIVAALIWGAAG